MSPTSYQTAPSRINVFFSCSHQQSGSLLVRKGGLEPPRPKALPPQGSVSTNSTTTAAVSHSSSLPTKLKGLISIIQLILVQLVKFHPIFVVAVTWFARCFVRFLNHRHLRFAFLQKQQDLNWLQKTTLSELQ